MSVSREAVIYAFRMLLGRDPESDKTILAHTHILDETELARALMRSNEFKSKNRFPEMDQTTFIKSKKLSCTRKYLILGNCQAKEIGRLLENMVDGLYVKSIELLPAAVERLFSTQSSADLDVGEFDLIFSQSLPGEDFYEKFIARFPSSITKFRFFPRIGFQAFHPDCTYVYYRNEYVGGSLGHYQSKLIFYCWKNGIALEDVTNIFNGKVFERLGYFNYWSASRKNLVDQGIRCGLELDSLIDKWLGRGCFMYSMNHPKLYVLADIARALHDREGIPYLPSVEDYLEDNLATGNCWPIYPEIAKHFGLNGAYYFKRSRSGQALQPVEMVDLDAFVRAAYHEYSKYSVADLRCHEVDGPVFTGLIDFIRGSQDRQFAVDEYASSSQGAGVMKNPYRDLPDHHFWRRVVERPARDDVDPVVRVRFQLKRTDRVATAGSCFAQHISRTLKSHGFNYYVAEDGAELSDELAKSRNYGVFSARFGNLYTARQLVQLFDRAYGRFVPVDTAWVREDGRFVDPFRPQIEPDGFGSIGELELSRSEHLARVREMFENLDYFVFTLGLTESWQRRADGAVFPLAPGVVAGSMDPERYAFVNFETNTIVDDVQGFIDRLRTINPRAQLILTVSPVPLIASYEDRHVLVSTTYSKAALRAAADSIVRRNSHCDYFPSFEIITGNFNHSEYYESDLRSIRSIGVDHVMRLFMKHYAGEGETQAASVSVASANISAIEERIMKETDAINQVVCDEELLDQ